MKKLIIDARLYGLEHTGIGRYIKGLLDFLPDDKSIQILVIVHKSHAGTPALFKYKKLYTSHHPYSFSSQLEIARILWKEKPDLLHIPHFTVPILWLGKKIVTIHDLIKHESRGPSTSTKTTYSYWIKYLVYKWMVNKAITESAHIIVPSQYWKNILIYKLPENKVTVTYEGVDDVYFKSTSRKTELKLKKPFILYVGNVYPHKNIETIIRAVVLLKGKVHFYISCARSVFWERANELIKDLSAEDWVTHLGFVKDEELVDIHRSSLAFVTASKIEGLGLPGLEAMAAGTPVISSNLSCLPEIYGNAALYFNPEDPYELKKRIEELLINNNLRKDLINKGKAQIERYSWGNMVKLTWDIYTKLLYEK
jgi:glycosyltransferase involved in cell wall biosynthesis